MKKGSLKNILHWVLAMLLCSFGVALCTKANLGLSMIAAVPYTLHIWLERIWPWFSQGTAEYCFQALLLFLTCLMIQNFKPRFLLCFLTAVIAGFCIDGWLIILGGSAPYELLWVRVATFTGGTILTAIAIALFFRTTWPLQVYELTVSELSECFEWKVSKVKWTFDIIMLLLAVVLSLVATGSIVGAGVGIGTVIITFANAPLIFLFGKLIDKIEKVEDKKEEVE